MLLIYFPLPNKAAGKNCKSLSNTYSFKYLDRFIYFMLRFFKKRQPYFMLPNIMETR